MKAVVVYKDQSDHAREVITWHHDFKAQTGHEIETLDPHTVEGISFCRIYDIVEYPTVIAIAHDGRQQQLWRGRPLPLISDVVYYIKDSV